MKESFRQSMAWLHTWTGLLLSWLLFAIFVTGTAAFFQHEITRWMEPEITGDADPMDSSANAVAFLEKTAPLAETWFITPPSNRSATTQVFWVPSSKASKAQQATTSAKLDPTGAVVTSRETKGGRFLYRFHFDLYYMPVRWARYIVGVAAMAMLIAILSGIVTHKKIFADFFMLRFGKGQRSWLDAHNMSAVFALPFHLMMTYTGLVTLASLYMPWGIAANYAEIDTFYEEVFRTPEKVQRSGMSMPLVPIIPLMEVASREWGGANIGFIRITNPGDETATITMTQVSSASIGTRGATLSFDGVSGDQIGASDVKGGAAETQSVMVGLHAGRYAGWVLRWLYFLSGLGGVIMIASGLILWTVKRRTKLPDPERPHFGFMLVERLNVATIAGLSSALAVYFLANRLLPVGIENRAAWEINSLFISWGVIFVWSISRPAKRAWVEALGLAACLYAVIPVVSAFTTPRNLLTSLLERDWIFVGFEGVMLALAAGFALASYKILKRKSVKRISKREQLAPTQMAAE